MIKMQSTCAKFILKKSVGMCKIPFIFRPAQDERHFTHSPIGYLPKSRPSSDKLPQRANLWTGRTEFWKVQRFMGLMIFLPLMVLSSNLVFANETAGMHRKLLLENKVELASKSVNAKVIRVHFPLGYKTPKHTHDGPGPRYVIKGKLKVIEGEKINTYGEGEVFWESGSLMTVENVGSSDAELVIFELAPAH